MRPHEIIDAYVSDVMRHISRRNRNDIGLELGGLLREMLNARAEEVGKMADAADTMAMLRQFGTPEEAAARYGEPGLVIVAAHQTRNFALLAIGGVLLQWALSFPAVIGGRPIAQWWFGAGLGALWWPGFLTLAAMAASWLRHEGFYRKTWKPRQSDTDSISPRAFLFGLTAFAVGTAIVASLPLVGGVLPQALAASIALDGDFLRYRAPLASLLWLAQFTILYAVYAANGWAPATRRFSVACDVLWLALLGWWIAGGRIFQLTQIDAFVKAVLTLLILAIALSLLAKFYRRRTRIAMLGHHA